MTKPDRQTASAAAAEPDPGQRVNFFSGMILGADEFTQEFEYHSGRRRWLARDLLGYGTVSGLRVGSDSGSRGGPQISVDAGAALGPGGRLIRVPDAQRIDLDAWLAAPERRTQIERHAVDNLLTLYLVLCYRERPTAHVPVPGDPGQSESEPTQPSRIADDFALELQFEPPDQREEDAVREFVAWLRALAISDGAPSSHSLEDFAGLMRAAAAPPGSPDPLMATPPPAGLHINRADADEYLRVALRLWVTELRPRWYRGLHDWAGASGDCVLLAALRLSLTATRGGHKVHGQIEIDESRRPVLASLRLVQELAAGRSQPEPAAGAASLAGDVTGPLGATEIAGLQGTRLEAATPADGQVLTFRAGPGVPAWVPATPAAQRGPAGLPGSPAPPPAPAPQTDAIALPAGAGAYRIVAAGVFEFDTTSERGFVHPLGPTYNNLRVIFSDPARRQIMFAFDDMEPPNFAEGHVYIIKALPWVLSPSPQQSFSVRLTALSGERFVLGLDFRHRREMGRGRSGRIMIEVSEYGHVHG
jgi:hypothetical protein